MAVNLNPSESTSALGTPADGMSSNATEFASTSRGNPARVSVTVPSNETSSNSLDDSSPDALKNTPSNIARLEDIIEHSEARRKYLAQTKSPSDGEDVRWYFCKVPLAPHELAASVPVTEIVGKSDYFRFSMRDSLALEASFLQREEELLSAWWKEYAECSEGPGGTGRSSVSAYGSESKSSPAAGVSAQNLSERGLGLTQHHDQIYGDAEETVGVPVKGGLYEVDLLKRHCFPVYWHGENRRVLRGHWFARKGGLEWLPLREDVAEQLEFAYRSRVWHRRTFQPSGQFAARVDLQGATKGLHALFTGEDKNWEAWLGVDAYGISLVIGVRGDGIKLRRGFAPSGSPQPTQDELRQRKEEEMDDYCSQVPVRHLVFMVHGIGQRLEKANLVDDVATFRHIVASLAEQHLTTYQCNAQRVLFIPCQWRRSLKLQGEAAVEKITLEGVRALRNMLSATVHDVLYYMSPIYCQDIIDSVSNQLNRLYCKFLKRNPGYDGKVSIYGHSLGSVLSYDILCHQENLFSFFPSEYINQSAVQNEDEQFGKVNDSSRNILDVHPLDSKQEEETVTDAGSSSHEHTVEPKQESESVRVPREATIELKKEEGTLNAPQDVQIESRQEAETVNTLTEAIVEWTRKTETVNPLQEDTVRSKEEFETVKALPEATVVLNQEAKTLNVGDKHIESNEDALSETIGDSTCNNSLKVIELLREEVASLKAKIMELEGQHRVNKITYGIVNDVGQSSSPMENKEDASGISTNVVRSLPSTSRQEDVSSVSVVGGSEGNMPCRPSKPGPVKKNADPRVESGKHYTPYVKYTKLDFKVDTFFAVGSPLGVFLALRNVRIGTGNGQEYWQDEGITEEMPSCRQMLNIFHPYDPVAYRLEPLVCKEYIEKRPIFIPYHKGGKRLHIGMQQFSEDLSARSKAFVKRLNFVRTRMVSVFGSSGPNKDEDAEDDAKKKQVKTYGSMIMDRLTGSPDGRLDYMLQDATFEHQYISAISSHTSYWRDLDTALFILKHLYREIPAEPPQANQSNIPKRRQSEDQVSSVDQTCKNDSFDEEVAFTFSGKKVINAFSSLKKNSKSIVKA